MVAWILHVAAVRHPTVLLAVETEPLIKHLTPVARLRVVLGLFLLLFLGLMIVWIVITGARIARRYRGKPLPPSATPDENDWTRKPLHSDDEIFDRPK